MAKSTKQTASDRQLGLTLGKPGRPPRLPPAEQLKHSRSYIHRELRNSASVFLNDAQVEKKTGNEERLRMYARAAIISAWSCLEAEVNGRLDQIKALLRDVQLHEIGLIEEKRVELRNGDFKLDGRIAVKLEDKIRFLFRKYQAPKTLDANVWRAYEESRDIRNNIVHAKGETGDKETVTIDNAAFLIATVDTLVDNMRYAHEGWLRKHRGRLRGL